MGRGPKTRIKEALDRANKEIAANAATGGMYARGLSTEGYAGGYAQALRDVRLVLDGIKPYDLRGYWQDWDK